MSYPNIPIDKSQQSLQDFSDNLLERKEFYQLGWSKDPNSYDILKGKFFRFQSYQLFCSEFLNPNTPYKRLLVNYQTGTGKCFAKGTTILMYDGSVKKIEEIKVGDQIMGDDSRPRNVKGLVRGHEAMVKIKPLIGEGFVCNLSHILSLKNTENKIINLTVKEYISKLLSDRSSNISEYGLFTSGATFPNIVKLDLNAYILGALTALDIRIDHKRREIKFSTKWEDHYSKLCVELSKCSCKVIQIEGDFAIKSYDNRVFDKITSWMLHNSAQYKYLHSDSKKQFLLGMLDFGKVKWDEDKYLSIDLGKVSCDTSAIIDLLRSLGYICVYDSTLKIYNIRQSDCINYIRNKHNKAICEQSRSINNIPFEIYPSFGTSHPKDALPNDRSHPKDVLSNDRSHPKDALPNDKSYRETLDCCVDYYGVTIDGNKRFLLANYIVVHNSATAIAIAQSFIESYRKIYKIRVLTEGLSRRTFSEIDATTPSVFVIGFTKANIIRELLKYPEFGFVTIEERDILDDLQDRMTSGDKNDAKRFKDYYNHLKRRITNKSKDGFYKFFGYQEFVNRIFISEDISLTQLESIAMARAAKKLKPDQYEVSELEESQIDAEKMPKISSDTSSLEDVIREYIDKKKIKINMQLLKQFENSLIICDEVQNTYNSLMKNNYGVAIQYVLDSVPSARGVFLTATPINNSPSEIVDVLNYLVPPEQKITKADFFETPRKVKDEKLEEIGKLSYGRVSFLQDINPKYYPSRHFMGVVRKLPSEIEGFGEIPYLAFRLCPMTNLQYATYNKYLSDSKISKYERPVIPTDGYTIYDMVFPNPSDDKHGLFKSSEIRSALATASETWRNRIGIKVTKLSSGYLYSGDWLKLENLKSYSSKYYEMMLNIFSNYEEVRTEIINSHTSKEAIDQKTFGQKFMIYHDRVKLSGVFMIQEILKSNGFIDDSTEPVDNTLCSICGIQMKDHIQISKKKSNIKFAEYIRHDFVPARFIVATSEIDKTSMENLLIKFNLPNNLYGGNYKILIGSKILREGYDIKDVREYHIMSNPVNMSAFIQELGRCIRKGSHANLPPEKRNVNVRLYLQTVTGAESDNKASMGEYDLKSRDSRQCSPEEYRYIEKISDYMVIQRIEKKLHEYAVDVNLHWDIIMPVDLLKEYFDLTETKDSTDRVKIMQEIRKKNLKPKNTIGSLYFEPKLTLEGMLDTYAQSGPQSVKSDGILRPDQLNLSTFTAYKYSDREVNTLMYVIKRLFRLQAVWKYDDLWKAARKPPFSMEVNPALFIEENFIIALNNLVASQQTYVDRAFQRKLKNENIADKLIIQTLFDPQTRYVYKGTVKHKIEQIGEYYILFPVVTNSDLEQTKDIVIRDIDSFNRKVDLKTDIRINIDSWLQDNKLQRGYEIQKKQFIAIYSQITDEYKFMDFLGEYEPEFQADILRDIISSVIDDRKVSKTESEIYERILEVYDQFRAIIYIEDILRYSEVAKKFSNKSIVFGGSGNKLKSKYDKDTPIGFIDKDNIQLYDSPHWVKTTKLSLNLAIDFKENNKLVGYYEKTADGVIKFKMRKPIQELKREIQEAERSGDTRTIQRGIVCSTKSKPQLKSIIELLDIKTDKKSKIKDICRDIKHKLLKWEIKERQKDTKIKYFYLWYDSRPDVTLVTQRKEI